jgi:5-methylcytosine-specific restriction endonuclease McrA
MGPIEAGYDPGVQPHEPTPLKTSQCIGCGAILPESDGPTHGYMESSPACWSTYSRVLAREYGDRLLLDRVHRLTVDSYAAQHPGRPSAQSIQSVAVHLISLCAVIENGGSNDWATQVMRAALREKGRFVWLPPPQNRGSLTVVDVWSAGGAADHEGRVREWATSVWAAWSPHHGVVRQWFSSLQHPAAAPGKPGDASGARGLSPGGRRARHTM